MRESRGLINRIYILGDLFEFWVGDDARDTLGHGEVEDILRATVQAGAEIFFIHGNRDFLIGRDFESRTGCRILPDPTVIELGTTRVLLTHGDSLCTDDTAHQQARQQMLTDKWKLAFLGKPIDERVTTANAMRKESEIGKKSKSMEIMDVNQQQVEKVMRDHDVLTMIHGHTHQPAVHDFFIDHAPAKRFVLGDWYTQKSMLLYDGGCFSLRR